MGVLPNSSFNHFCCVEDFERYALNVLPKSAADYFRSGSYEQFTLRNNKEAFRRLRIRPKVLVSVPNRSAKTVVLGSEVRAPIGVSPSAMQKMAHPEGECANARAAGSIGTIYILSTLSTTSLEDVAAAAPDTIKWFQLYVYKDRKLAVALIRRAEKAGYKALVLTVDANIFGSRYADMRNNFQLPKHLTLGNFAGAGEKSVLKLDDTSDSGSALNKYTSELFDETICWKDVTWLKSVTKLPIVLKGILTAEDALKAAEIGVHGVMVSNHGGRQLDTAPASIEALPEVVKAVGSRMEVYLDGGIRTGSDVFKAIAVGAKMVFVGRPALWGLTYDGEEGVRKVLNILIEEFRQTLGLAGCDSVSDIESSMVVHESFYHKL